MWPHRFPGASGPGRPRDRHTRAYGSEWSISKPARALRTLRRPPHRWGRGGLQSGGTWCAPLMFRAPPGPAARSPLALHVVACGTAGVPGASGPGRPRDRHTRAYGSEWSISKPARALRTLRRPPHRWGRGGLQSGGTWCACTWPGPAAAHRHRGQDYSQPSHNKRSEKPRPLQWLRSLCHGFPTMSHAIPLPLFQTLNSHR